MSRGGARPGSGRPQGSHQKLTNEARATAKLTGRLPHEILLDIARGNPQTIKLPLGNGKIEEKLVGVTLEQLADAAKAAAPYFAPKISTVEVIHGVPDDELDNIIAQLASEAGIDLGNDGKGKTGEDAPTARRRVVIQP